MVQAPSLKELEKSLYEREKPKLPSQKPVKEVVIGPTDPTVPPPPAGEDGGISRFGRRRFFSWLGIIIVLALALSVFIFWRGFFSFTKGKVDLSINGPEKIEAASLSKHKARRQHHKQNQRALCDYAEVQVRLYQPNHLKCKFLLRFFISLRVAASQEEQRTDRYNLSYCIRLL